MAKIKKSDMERFIKLYSKMDISFTIRPTVNDPIATYSFMVIGKSEGVAEILFDENGKFIEQNFFCD
jgi:glycosylphosphatidylinositol transamidase (GPIT) subunit GPI8